MATLYKPKKVTVIDPVTGKLLSHKDLQKLLHVDRTVCCLYHRHKPCKLFADELCGERPCGIARDPSYSKTKGK